jgi:hypothetical protein
MQMVVDCEETMTPQRLRRRWIVETLDDSNHVDWAPVMERLNVICEVNADQLERNAGIRQFYVKDHPEANSRTAVKGEHGYTLRFPLQDGTELQVLCGEETLTRFSDMIGRMLIDNDAEAK